MAGQYLSEKPKINTLKLQKNILLIKDSNIAQYISAPMTGTALSYYRRDTARLNKIYILRCWQTIHTFVKGLPGKRKANNDNSAPATKKRQEDLTRHFLPQASTVHIGGERRQTCVSYVSK